tara:strand:+ start:1081 stop:1998 length:918 start_codon:yes stop_codon:yes gene_type:complete
MNKINGFLIINKEKGCTSHDCVKIIRKVLNIKKVGHTGTLDPEVTGILPVAIGNATRFIQYLPQEKCYLGEIKLGISTSTDDIHGKIINRVNWPQISTKQLDNVLNLYRGDLKQVPPKVSSVHINGERAYKKVLKNEEFELSPKDITISELILKKWDQKNGIIKLKIKCSAGTYIRALARDLGSTLNTSGCLYDLKRTSACGFDEETSNLVNLKDIPSNIDSFIMPTISALKHLPTYILKNEEEINWWETGRKIILNSDQCIIYKNIKNLSTIQVIDSNKNLLGIGIFNKKDDTFLQPKLVLNAR